MKITQLQLNCQMKNLDRGWCAQGINPRLVVRLKHLQYLYSLFSVYNNKNNCSKLIMRSLQFQIKSFLFLLYQIFEPSVNFSAEFKSLWSAANHGIPCVSNRHFMLNVESLLCFCVRNFNKILTYNSYCSQFSIFIVRPVMFGVTFRCCPS